jgi:molybdopterin molybdotransferase
MIDIKEALGIIEREIKPLASERIGLADSVGRVLAEDIIADMDLPPFDRSQMDGFAVIADETVNAPVSLQVVGESAAGNGWRGRLKRGHAVRIMTGARVPSGADAVQKVELTSENAEIVNILERVKEGTAIVRRASEIARGTAVYHRGTVITENMIAVLASFGYAKVRVAKRPRISILGTGSEIVEITKKPGRDQIRNSNSIMLEVSCCRLGASTIVLPIVADEVRKLKKALQTGCRSSDILIITGGVSVGKYDHTKAVLAELRAQIFFEKLSLKPGKPLVFARLGRSMVFGLPGNPVSAAVTFQLFVRTAILLMQGAADPKLRRGKAVAAADVKANRQRDTYLPSRLETDEKGRLSALPLRWHGSSDFVGYAQADSLMVIPRGESRKKDEIVEIVYM